MFWAVLLLVLPASQAMWSYQRQLDRNEFIMKCQGESPLLVCATYTCPTMLSDQIVCSRCTCAGQFEGAMARPGGSGRRCPPNSCDIVCWPQGYIMDNRGCRTCACNAPGVCQPPRCRRKCRSRNFVKTYDSKGCPICICRKQPQKEMSMNTWRW